MTAKAPTSTSGLGRPTDPDKGRSGLPGMPDMSRIIGYKLRRAQLAVFQDFIESVQTLNLRPAEFSVLSLIAETPGQKQTDIATALAIKPANLVTLIDGLERRNLAERRKDGVDKRAHSLYLTDRGYEFCQDMIQLWQSHEDRFIKRLGGTKQRDQFVDMLDRIIDDSEPAGA